MLTSKSLILYKVLLKKLIGRNTRDRFPNDGGLQTGCCFRSESMKFGLPPMKPNQLNSNLGYAPRTSNTPSRMSVLSLIFFMLGTPNIYAFLQQRAATQATYGGVPRYALAVIVAACLASIVELSII